MKVGDQVKIAQSGITAEPRKKNAKAVEKPLKSKLTDKASISGEARQSRTAGLKTNIKALKHKILETLKGNDKDVSVLIPYGKQEKVKLDGRETVFKGDGQLDAFITDKLAQRPNLMAKGIITDIKDPRITKLLGDQARMSRLRAAGEGNRGLPADAEFGQDWKVGRSVSSTTTQGKTYEMDNLELYNPELEGGFSLNKVTLSTGKKDAEGGHFVTLEGANDQVFANGLEKITASYDPKTGKIKDETINKWVYARAKKAE